MSVLKKNKISRYLSVSINSICNIVVRTQVQHYIFYNLKNVFRFLKMFGYLWPSPLHDKCHFTVTACRKRLSGSSQLSGRVITPVCRSAVGREHVGWQGRFDDTSPPLPPPPCCREIQPSVVMWRPAGSHAAWVACCCFLVVAIRLRSGVRAIDSTGMCADSSLTRIVQVSASSRPPYTHYTVHALKCSRNFWKARRNVSSEMVFTIAVMI